MNSVIGRLRPGVRRLSGDFIAAEARRHADGVPAGRANYDLHLRESHAADNEQFQLRQKYGRYIQQQLRDKGRVSP